MKLDSQFGTFLSQNGNKQIGTEGVLLLSCEFHYFPDGLGFFPHMSISTLREK